MYFTVVIPLYNKKRHIKRAIKSIINQTYQNFEIIVVDDGSTDNSFEEVVKIRDDRIRLIRQKNGGVSSARNKGIDESKYDYIGFLDADDMWKPNFLESIKNLIIKYPYVGAYATAYEIKKEDGNIVTSFNFRKFKNEWEGIIDDYFKYAMKQPLISASSVVVPKVVFKIIGKFSIDLKRGEDLEMWCRVALDYDIAYLNKICVTYFHDADNRVCKKKAKLEQSVCKNSEYILKTTQKLGKSSYYFEEYMIQSIIFKARYLINEDKIKEARKLLYKYKYTKLNKKSIIKTYVLSWVPKSIKHLYYVAKDKVRNVNIKCKR